SLIASFTLSPQASASIEGIDQISGITVNDFSSPVIYIVTAGNNTLKEWRVTVTEAPNSENDFLTYSLPGQYGATIIDTVNHSIEIELHYTNELDNLIATFTLPPQAVSEVDGLIQESGITPNDFSDVVTYTVIAGDQSKADWNVLVSVLPNNETDILTFSFDEQAGPALIDPENHTINIEVEYGIALSDLVAIFTLSPYANAYIGSDRQESGVTINDFSNPVIYTILAGDNTTMQDWEIFVSVEAPSIETDFLSFSLNEEIGQKVIDTLSHEILIMVEEGTQLDELVASFSLSEGATAYVDDVFQISGVTINDFSNPVIYTIIAEDNTTMQTWTVIVSIAFDFFYIREPLSFPVNNEAIEISARAPEYESIENVLFHYRKIEAQQWSVLDVFGIQGIYRVDVLRNMVGNSGMFYFFSATDTTGNILLLDYNHLVIHYDTESPQIPGLRFGGTVNQYQIISIPLNLQNPNAEEVFNELGEYNIKQWRLFHHDGISTKEYKDGFTNINPGLGFWLIIRNQTSITTGEGYTVRIDSTNGFEIDLRPGWNQIGNPFDMDISWDNVILDNNNLNIGRIKLYNHDTLTEASVIPRFRGGFVFLEGVQPITAKVRPSQVGWNARKQPYVDTDRLNSINQGNWITGLSVSNGTVTNTVSGIGMHPEAIEGKDRYDEVLLPVPKEIIPFELAFNHPYEKYRKFGVDVVQSTDQYIWEFEVKSFTPSQSLTISWDNTYFGNNEYKLILNHVGPEALINMKDMNSYTFNADEIEQFRIVFGDDAFIKDMLKPQSITFSTGYPNPFRDQMTIPFTLPDSGSDYSVNISVYDLTGNMIKMMTNKNYSSGYYTINWNTLDSPDIFSSGIYLIKMEVRSDKINTILSQKVIKQ
ncbi:MAG: T9SS type A sorting domain-containing protein, partial [Candidatus Kariarchaeaceae archaeon]